MPQTIIWRKPDGFCNFTVCANGVDPTIEASRLKSNGSIPQSWVFVSTESDVVKDEYRNSWTVTPVGVRGHDLPTAKVLHVRMVEFQCERLLILLALEEARTVDPVRLEEIRLRRIVLQGLPATINVTSATSVSALRTAWPTSVIGSPIPAAK